jgi:hypothetical protein
MGRCRQADAVAGAAATRQKGNETTGERGTCSAMVAGSDRHALDALDALWERALCDIAKSP